MGLQCIMDPQWVLLSLLCSFHSEASGQDHQEGGSFDWDFEPRPAGVHHLILLYGITLLPHAVNTAICV